MNNTLIIAEAGVNHNGNLDIAKRLIDVAHDVGADIVKFQTGLPNNVISKYAPKAEYQRKKKERDDEGQLEMARKFSLDYAAFDLLKKYAEKVGIRFLSTSFDIESSNYLHNLGIGLWKIPSGEITNLPYLENIASFHEPIIMSTGMATMDEIREAISVLMKNGAKAITLLHCTTSYPTIFSDVNLNAMLSMKREFGLKIGYSDHTLGIEVPIAAVAMGATVIEKHFTLDRKMEGPDHQASLEPSELRNMVIAIRNIEKALGDNRKYPCNAEKANMIVARKSIVAKCNIKKGEIFADSNLTTKRPGNGISPMRWYQVLGTKATRDYLKDELITI